MNQNLTEQLSVSAYFIVLSQLKEFTFFILPVGILSNCFFFSHEHISKEFVGFYPNICLVEYYGCY